MNRIFLALVLILSGCATPAERRKQAPDLDLVSNKTAKEVTICIAEKWENTKPFMAFSSPPVNTNMRSNGFSITVTDINRMGSTSVIALADIIETESSSNTKYYKMAGGGFGDYDAIVKLCQ
jgi:hypothetical protein